MECERSICSYCGICDPCIIESQADFVCQQCVPLRCNECGRVLIGRGVWEERIEHCNDCDKRFCNQFLSSSCLAPLYDEYGEEMAWECRRCIRKPKVHTDVATLQKYLAHLEEQGLEQKDVDFEDWVSQQNDSSLVYRNPMQRSSGISKANHTEQEVIDSVKNGAHVMSRAVIHGMLQQARCMGRLPAPPPLKCHSCGSANKDQYCMLGTHHIEFECIDCAIQAALDARYGLQ